MKTILAKKFLSAIVISTGVLLVTVSSQAEIYKWTDAKGVTHYSSQKPIQHKIKTENIEDKIRSAAGKYRASEQQASQKSAQTTTKSNDSESKTELSGPNAKLVSYCKGQRKSLAQLKKNFRNIWKDENGKTYRLDQKQRQLKVDQIHESITKECAGV